MSWPPAKRASPNASASCWSASGISRMDGAWIGAPPWLRINSATSADRRLSKLTSPLTLPSPQLGEGEVRATGRG